MFQRQGRSAKVFIGLACILTGVAFPSAAGEFLLTPNDILNTRWASSVAMSPDGSRVVYVVYEPADASDSTSSRTSTLWISSTEEGADPERIALGHFHVASPRWSADNVTLAFLSNADTSTIGSQVWIHDVRTRDLKCVTSSANGVAGFHWSPSGKEIAFLSANTARRNDDPIEVGLEPPRNELWVLDLASSAQTLIDTGGQHVVDFDWAPTEDKFAAILSPSSDADDIFRNSQLTIVSRENGLGEVLSRNVADRSGVAWSPDGAKIAFPAFAPKRFAWRLAVLDVVTGERLFPLSEYPGTSEPGSDAFVWSNDSKQLWLRTIEGTRCRLLRVDIETQTFERVTDSVNNFWSFGISRDADRFVFAADTPQSPPDVVLADRDNKSIKLTDLNPQLSTFRLGSHRELKWQNSVDGKTVFGVLVLPPDYDPGKTYPTIVLLHGGPQAMWWNSWLGTQLSWGQQLASRGYVVFHPNPRGSIGQGWEFVEAVHRDWGGMDVRDVLDGVDVLVEQKIADPDRLAIGGWSYGGFLTAATTTQTDRFKAAIVGAGITDLYTYALTVDEVGWVRGFLGGDEISDRERYRSLSPLTHIEKCKTPTLVLHGENDKRCPLTQGRSWYRGLKAQNVESEMVVYPNAGHVLSSRSHQIDLMRRVADWFDKHLQP